MEYRLDKNYFKKQSAKEAGHNEIYWRGKSIEERLTAAWYLTCQAYNISFTDPPRIDKTYFNKRRREK
jgi:hypothetical protein